MQCPKCGANKKGELDVQDLFGEKNGNGSVNWKSRVECICGCKFIYPDESADKQVENDSNKENKSDNSDDVNYKQDSLF